MSFLCCGTSCFKNDFSSQCQKEPVSYINQYSCILYGLLAGQRVQRPISLPPVIAMGVRRGGSGNFLPLEIETMKQKI